jgi:hypothetical protein
MTDQQPPNAPPPEAPVAPPAPAAPPPPSGWGQPPAPPASAWVAPVAARQQGPVTGLAKLGALVLVVFGLLWALIGVLFVVAVSAIRDLADLGPGFRDLAAGLFVGIGIVILFIALVEILAGIFAWRGSGLGRFIGIVYGLVFGGGTLLPVLQGSQTDVAGAQGGALFLLVFAVGYLYTLVVFLFRWRRAA